MKLFENFQSHKTVFYFRDIPHNSSYITTQVQNITINAITNTAKITTINNDRVFINTTSFLDYTYKKLLECFCRDLNLDNNFEIVNSSLFIQNNSSSWLYLDNELFLKDPIKYLEDFFTNFPQFKKPIENYLLTNNTLNRKFTKELSVATGIPFEFFNHSGTDLSVSKTQKESDNNLTNLSNATECELLAYLERELKVEFNTDNTQQVKDIIQDCLNNNQYESKKYYEKRLKQKDLKNTSVEIASGKRPKEIQNTLESLSNAKLKRLECLDVSHPSTRNYEQYVKERDLEKNIKSYNHLGKPSIGDNVILQAYNEFITVKVISDELKNNEIMLMSDAFGTYIKPLSDLLPLSYLNMVDFFRYNLPEIYKNMSIHNSCLILNVDPCFGYCHIKLCLINYTRNLNNFLKQLSVQAPNHTKDIEKYLTKTIAKNNEDKNNKEIAITAGIPQSYINQYDYLLSQDYKTEFSKLYIQPNLKQTVMPKFNKGDIVKVVKDFIVNLNILKVKKYNPDDSIIFEKNKIIESTNLKGMIGVFNLGLSVNGEEFFINIKGKNFFVPEDNLILVEEFKPSFKQPKPDKRFYDQAYESIDGVILPSTIKCVELIQDFKNNG